MRIKEQWTDEVLVLSVRGRLNTEHRADMLRQMIDKVVALGHRRLVLDVQRLRHVDQPGLDTILRCRRTDRRARWTAARLRLTPTRGRRRCGGEG